MISVNVGVTPEIVQGGGGIMLLKHLHQIDVSVLKAERVCIQGWQLVFKVGHLYSKLAICIKGYSLL